MRIYCYECSEDLGELKDKFTEEFIEIVKKAVAPDVLAVFNSKWFASNGCVSQFEAWSKDYKNFDKKNSGYRNKEIESCININSAIEDWAENNGVYDDTIWDGVFMLRDVHDSRAKSSDVFLCVFNGSVYEGVYVDG